MKHKEKKKEKKFRCINGVKGAISLFLAVLMTPFLTIAVLLVEVGRYNSAVSILDEALGVSSLSTLANYDPYLQDRWGLLALSQDVDINSIYSQNLEVNSNVMGSTFTIDNVSAQGDQTLKDLEILEYQLMEYCKLNAPTTLTKELASKLMSMLDFVKNIEKALSNVKTMTSLATKGVSTIDSGITMVKSADELKKTANELDQLKKDYNKHYTAFEDAANTLIDNLKDKKEQEEKRKPLKEDLTELQNELAALEAMEAKTAAEKKAKEEAIDKKKEEIKEKEEEIEPYDKAIKKLEGTIKSNRSSTKEAKETYTETVAKISTALTNFRENMVKCQEAAGQIKENIAGAVTDSVKLAAGLKSKKEELAKKEEELKTVKKTVEEWKGSTDDATYQANLKKKGELEADINKTQTELGELQIAQSTADATANGVEKMANEFNESFKEYNDKTTGQIIAGFDSLKEKLEKLNTSSINAETQKVNKDDYKNVSVSGYIAADDIQAYLDAQEKDLKEGSLKAMLDGLIAMYEKIMSFDLFYVPELSATIDVQYYIDNLGGLPGGKAAENPVLEVMKDIGKICQTSVSLQVNLLTLKFLKLLEDLKTLVETIVSLFQNIEAMIKTFVTNVVELFDYQKFYYTTYCTYNLACRTDYDPVKQSTSFSTMTGYSVGEDSFDKIEPLNQLPGLGSIAALVDTIVRTATGNSDDLMFNGAELEYIMFGSTSEIANQLYAFVAVYLIRLVSSLPALMADAEVQSLAASATLGYPVVMALYILLEPLMQTALLVNGSDQPMIPTEVYLSPSGLPKLVGELISFCKLTTKQAEELSKNMADASLKTDEEKAKYKEKLKANQNLDQKVEFEMDLSYKDYCWAITALTVTKAQMRARLCNLIQMETLCYYQNMKKEYTFDLSKSFTALNVTVDASINQIMPSLADSSLFKVKREHYRGY